MFVVPLFKLLCRASRMIQLVAPGSLSRKVGMRLSRVNLSIIRWLARCTSCCGRCESKQEFKALYVIATRSTVRTGNGPPVRRSAKGVNKGYRIPGISSHDLQEARGWKLAFESIGTVLRTVHRAGLPYPNDKAPNHTA